MKKFIRFYYSCSFKVCLWAFLSLIGIMFLSSSAFALQSGDFYYTVNADNTVTITGYNCPGGPAVIPDTIDGMPVVGIGVWAFYNCRGLTSVTIPGSVTSIGEQAFVGCGGLSSVTIPNSVTSIGEMSFLGCTGLTNVTIGNSVTSIGYGAFFHCLSLTSVTIPGSVTSIGSDAFGYCSGLTSIVVDASNTVYSSLDGVLYDKAKTVLIQYPGGKSGGFTIPDSVTIIGSYAFAYCYSLTSVTIPDSVTSIGSGAFASCTRLTSVTIGNSVTSIEDSAFRGCSGLTSVTIPDSVTSIESYAFVDCSGLTRAYFLGNAPAMGEYVFAGCTCNFSICYTTGRTGFTNPWYGYPAAVCSPQINIDYKQDYHDYQEMITLLSDLATQASAKTPNVFSLQIIGYSYQNKPIYAVKFSDNPQLEQEDKPVVVIDSGIHAREWLPVESNLNFIQYLFNAYYTIAHTDHNEVVDLVNNFEIWIIPMINVDGRIRDDLNHGDPSSYYGWRKNVQEVPCPADPSVTTQGIDINRNFSYAFYELSGCLDETYSGTVPFAATEARVLKQFINNHMVSLVLHQHSNAQVIFSAPSTAELGAYLSVEADAIYDVGLPTPLMALLNGIELMGTEANSASMLEKLSDSISTNSVSVSPAAGQQGASLDMTITGSNTNFADANSTVSTVSFGSSGITVNSTTAACNGNSGSGQYFQWLWFEIDCSLAPDNHSRRAIQNVFYEYPFTHYGCGGEYMVGQYAPYDGSDGFHPSSGEMDQWIIDKNVEINKYLIRQSRYPFSPRYHEDMSRRPEAPVTDLALVGAKISEPGNSLPGCLITDSTGRDLLEPGMKRVTWNVQNNGTSSRTINSNVTICNLTDDPSCLSPFTDVLSRENVLADAIETFTYDYAFTPKKDYSLTLTTGESNSYENDLKRFMFSTTEITSPPIERSVDIKPGSCPNPVGFADNKGVVPFAIMGTTEFDITQIDTSSIRIRREGVDAEVAPIRWSYEDVATPFEGELCDCHELTGDGHIDLSMKVYRHDLVYNLKLQDVAGNTVLLTVTGKLKNEFGGTPIEGKDCVRVLKAVLKDKK